MDADAAFARQLLAETREELLRADGKASIILAASGVVFGVVLSGLATGDVTIEGESGLVQVLALASASATVIAVVAAAVAVFPAMGRPVKGRARYFGDVAAYPIAGPELREALSREARRAPGRDVEQLHALAVVVRRKYRSTRVTLLAFGSAITAGGLASILSL